MSGEGEGGGGGGYTSTGSGDFGGGDIGAILGYLNHQSFGTDGDLTGNAGFSGDNTGPVGSKVPEKDQDLSVTPIDALTIPPWEIRGKPYIRDSQNDRSWVIGPYGGMGGQALLAFVGEEVDAFSGLRFGIDNPDPFTGFPASDPFIGEWPDRARNVTAPFAALRQTNLLSSPDLLADNDVTTCNPNRTSCLPEAKSDANQSSLATLIQADMDESYVAIQAVMEGRTKIVGDTEVDMQKMASTAAQVARSDEYKLGFIVNQLRDHPLEIQHSAVLTGLGHLVVGSAAMTASGFIIYGSGGLALPLVGATGFAAGAGEAFSGLALAASGADSTETVRMSGQLDYVFALTSSPTSLVFGTTGLVLSGGDVGISHRFAIVGGIAEGMTAFRSDPSKLYSTLLPGVGTKTEKAASALLVKDVAALGHTGVSESISVAAAKLNRDFTVADLLGIEAFREEMASTGRLDLAGIAGHEAAGAAPRGVDFFKYNGAFQQELKFHGPYTPLYSLLLDKAWNQSLTYSIKYQMETLARGGVQLVPLRSVKHIWVSPTEAIRLIR
ncbi:hypothetical protein [Streptosporangium sp. NBC_01469]|uniref:hypothetical protein n=1 Tax=Streptosporangium sp. NBC_01469 TaxID=2903898 RepID=UPI002E2D3DCD|nr:hypothetical protein [Streptosporangium sp. NBC_01469]